MLGILVTTYDPKHLLNQNKWLEGIDSEVNKIVFVTNYENLDKVGEIAPSRIARFQDSLRMELTLGMYTIAPPSFSARPRIGSMP